MAREQATSDFFLEGPNTTCTSLQPPRLWNVLCNQHKKMKNVLINTAKRKGEYD